MVATIRFAGAPPSLLMACLETDLALDATSCSGRVLPAANFQNPYNPPSTDAMVFLAGCGEI